MGKKKPEDRKVVRNRRVMIYTFLLIFIKSPHKGE